MGGWDRVEFTTDIFDHRPQRVRVTPGIKTP